MEREKIVNKKENNGDKGILCVFNAQTDEARHMSDKSLADNLFNKINVGYISEINNGKEKILRKK